MAAHLGGCWRRVVLAVALCLLGSGSARAYTVKQTGSGATVRWHRPAVTLRVDPSMYKFFGDMPIKRIASRAAGAWTGLPGVPELLISEGEPGPVGFADGGDPTNGVYLIENWVLAESSLAVTVATFESSTGRIVDTDVLVNPNHPFSHLPEGDDSKKADSFDLLGVLTHEMGHVIGLGESFDVRMATMWPNIARGELHQRDLDDDDMAGAEEAYAGAPLSEQEAPAKACARSSVVLSSPRSSTGIWLGTGIALIALFLWARRSDAMRGRAGVSMLAGVLLFATPLRPQSDSDHERVEVMRTLLLRRLSPEQRRVGILEAARSQSVPVRLAAAAVLERNGTAEDRDIAARMLSDSDVEVRNAARRALARLRTAPPAARVAKNHPIALERLGRLLDGASEVVSGEVVQAGTSMRQGIVWSRYLVHGKGRVLDVEIPGGSLGGYTQIVSEQEPPEDGDSVIVAVRPDGRRPWAHLRGGLVYGGWLGDGPAIEW